MRKTDITLTPTHARQITVGGGAKASQLTTKPSKPHPEVVASHAISRARNGGVLRPESARTQSPSKSRSQSPDAQRSKLARAQSPQPKRARVVEVDATTDATATRREGGTKTSGAAAAAADAAAAAAAVASAADTVTPKQRADALLASIPSKATARPKSR